MPDFTPLDPRSERQVAIMNAFARKKRAFLLRKHHAEAAIGITDAIAPLLDDDATEDRRIKARLYRRSAGAHERMANYPGAIRFCEFRIRKAVEWLRGRGVL
ncbi:MAG: hypothetical protein PVH30_14110 [Desulfobacterales bacterium]|jgi:hypothetical protein